jgi:hypothetical protein
MFGKKKKKTWFIKILALKNHILKIKVQNFIFKMCVNFKYETYIYEPIFC